jgi:transposase
MSQNQVQTISQTVIDLGHFIRNQRAIPLDVPCTNLIINTDLQFHSDIKSQESYIKKELNVQNVIITADGNQYGVNYKLLPDANAIGAKYNQKDASKISRTYANQNPNYAAHFTNEVLVILEKN